MEKTPPEQPIPPSPIPLVVVSLGGAVAGTPPCTCHPQKSTPGHAPLDRPSWANTTVTFNSVNCQSLLAAINNFACTTLDCCNVVLQTESVGQPGGSATNPSLGEISPQPGLRFFKDLKENSSCRKDSSGERAGRPAASVVVLNFC